MKHIFWLLLLLLASSSALAQTGSLRGLVTDQNGGVIPGAKVTVNGLSGFVRTTNADTSGSYSFTGLPPGDYEVQASAANLELGEPVKISLKVGVQTLDLQLKVILAPEKVTERLAHDPVLMEMARIVQAADIKGHLDDHLAARGLQLISRGFPLVTSSGDETAERAAFVYDALYASIKQDQARELSLRPR